MSTYTNFKIETDADGIALVTWDMPEKSMNVFTAEVMEELNAIVDATVADAAVKGVVFTSGKSTFSGGADLSMIKSMFSFYHEEKTKNPDEAAQKLFDLVGKMNVSSARSKPMASRGCPPSTAPAWVAPSNCRSPAMAVWLRAQKASRSRFRKSRLASSPARAERSAFRV